MPELPEVETIRRGLIPYVLEKKVKKVIVRQRRLRWPVPTGISRHLAGQKIKTLGRRGKYLYFTVDSHVLVMHFGMSGCLRLLSSATEVGPHDHLDIELTDGLILRFQDPRRFGSVHLCRHLYDLPLVAHLGPEPLTSDFHGAYLTRECHRRRTSIKNTLMNNRVVAGIGNIYANEALFSAGIHPLRPSNRLSARRLHRLAATCKQVLEEAIRSGGTTLNDFVDTTGRPGFFQLAVRVYGRSGEQCVQCSAPIRCERSSGRAVYYCPRCQR